MIVVVDMILAVAEVSLAAGTIPELQLRVGEIGPAADSTFVSVRRFGGGNGSLIRSGIGEGNGLCFLLFGTALFEQPPGIHAPGHGDHIEDIFSKEQKGLPSRPMRTSAKSSSAKIQALTGIINISRN